MAEDADTEPVAGGDRPALGAFPERYEPGDELGRGGMGRVVEAHDKMLGRTVALKEALATGEDALRRFARETQITARLEHPSIVPVYDAGVSPEGSPFYVMRKVTGRPLEKLVQATHRLDQRLALLPNVLAACQAIAHAHERGVIHRDLKPNNILVGAHGETIVIDWGLAKAHSDTDQPRAAREPTAAESLRTQAGAVFGTPGFMSPEQQTASDDVDERADVYALGATLYYTLSTKIPPAEGPVPPIAFVVPSVPRELSTIVDKALAELPVRYRNAGALAEDLERFTTGQLVAAHDYSTSERIARFVRRHRALVITVAAATVVLAIGAWIAVGRVLSARDEAIDQARAAEAARARETERASDLVVSQARLLLETNPTGALAMVRPLAATSRWREVRAIAAGARSSGIPHRLPAPSNVTFMAMSDDGLRAVASGSDGSIHLYDLEARSHTLLATLTGRIRVAFADDRRILAWTKQAFTVIDVATKATTVFERPSPILHADVHEGTAYFVDETRQAWRLDVATGQVIGVPIPGKAAAVAISPNGKYVAFGGENLWMIETKHPELVELVHAGKKFDLVWAPNSEKIGVVGESSVFNITVHPETTIGEYGVTNQSITIARGLLYTTGISGLTIAERKMGEADLQSAILGMYPTKGEFVVGAGRGELRVFDGYHEHEIPLPETPMTALRASPRSPYILAVCGGALLLWNVEDVMPKRIEVPVYAQLLTVGLDRVWTITNGGPARSIDVHTLEARDLGKLAPLHYASASTGEFVVGRPLAIKESWIVSADGTVDVIDSGGKFATVLDGKRAVYATKLNEIVIYDIATRARQKIATYGAGIDRLIARQHTARWLVATFDDGTIARHDLQAGTATQTRIPTRTHPLATGVAVTAATKTGDVFFVSGERLVRWPLAGAIEDHVVLPQPISAVHLLDEERLLAITIEGGGYLVGTVQPTVLRLPAFGQTYSWATDDPTLIVTDDRTGGVTVLDVVANVAWKIARATPAGMTPDISGDGTVAVMRDASLDSTAVALWSLDLPTTPEATARWIDELTTATFDPRTGRLGWPTP